MLIFRNSLRVYTAKTSSLNQNNVIIGLAYGVISCSQQSIVPLSGFYFFYPGQINIVLNYEDPSQNHIGIFKENFRNQYEAAQEIA